MKQPATSDYIRKIYEARSVVGLSGKAHKLTSEIDEQEGEFLSKLIHEDSSVQKTLEIGCAYGLSSLFICTALQGRDQASHLIIDPYQTTQWDGAGIKNLTDAGIGFFAHIEEKSEIALPRLLAENEGGFDLIFIDGWHTFDHTLVDCFYATRLLRVGGYLVIDDVSFPSIRRVVAYFSNYPCYREYDAIVENYALDWKRILARTITSLISRKTWAKFLAPGLYRKLFDDRKTKMIALKKTQEDNRDWNWHADSF